MIYAEENEIFQNNNVKNYKIQLNCIYLNNMTMKTSSINCLSEITTKKQL